MVMALSTGTVPTTASTCAPEQEEDEIIGSVLSGFCCALLLLYDLWQLYRSRVLARRHGVADTQLYLHEPGVTVC